MSRLYRAESVSQLGVALFSGGGGERGSGPGDGGVAGHQQPDGARLTRSDQDSGVSRIRGRRVDRSLTRQLTVERTGPTTAVVDCHRGFGAVGAERAIREGIAIAREERTACVITRSCNHVGRLGAWVQIAADEGMLALATCNSPIHGHFVLPWGGREGRLATNPIAYAVPTGGDPVVADFSTSVAPEGKIRFYRNEGKSVPDGWILDADGKPTNDPNAFYGPPRGGILPLGAGAGHKGFAVGLLVEILGSALAGLELTRPASGSATASASSSSTPRRSARSRNSDGSWTKPWPTSSRHRPPRGSTKSWFRVNSNSAR